MGGLALAAMLTAAAVDTAAADSSRGRVIDTVVGTGEPANHGDGGPATQAAVRAPATVASAPDGTLYVVTGLTVRAVDPDDGTISTVAGTGKAGFGGDGGPATKARFGGDSGDNLSGLTGIAVGPDGTLYLADTGNHRIRAVDPETHRIRTVAGKGEGREDRPFTGDGGPATEATLHYPSDVAVGKDGTLYINDALNYRIRAVDPETKEIRTVAGVRHPGDEGSDFFPQPDSDGKVASNTFVEASGIAVGNDGLLYLAEDEEDRVRVVNTDKDTIRTLVGRGTSSYLDNPTDLAVDGDTLYIAANDVFAQDETQNRVYAYDLEKEKLRTFAGGSDDDRLGDGDRPTDAYLGGPGPGGTMGITVGPDGAVYIADGRNNRVRVVRKGDPRTARAGHRLSGEPITTLLGSGKQWTAKSVEAAYEEEQGTFYRDVHDLDEVDLDSPESVAVARDGTLYVADTGNDRIRVVEPGDDTVRTLAGTHEPPDSDEGNGDGGDADEANLSNPRGLVLGPDRKLYFTDNDSDGASVRYVDLDEGTVDTVRGSKYELSGPDDLAFDRQGRLYVADTDNGRVCRMELDADSCTTVAGGDEDEDAYGIGISPKSIAVGGDGTLYVADTRAFRILAFDLEAGTRRLVAGIYGRAGFSGDGNRGTSAEIGPVSGLDLGPRGTLYFTDEANHRVRAVDLESGVVTAVAGNGSLQRGQRTSVYGEPYGGGAFSGDGGPARKAELDNPGDVEVGPDGELYLADTGNNRIRVVGDIDVSARGGIEPVTIAAPLLVVIAVAAGYFYLRRRRVASGASRFTRRRG